MLNIDDLKKKIEADCKGQIKFHKKREGLYQVYLPVYYEDGDMVDIFLTAIKGKSHSVCLTDCGTTYMKLTYSYEINTPAKEILFDKILAQNGVKEEGGQFFLESDIDQLFHSLMQFSGCQQKILNMRMWQRETIKSLFIQDLDEFMDSEMNEFSINKKVSPLPDSPVEVDYQIDHSGKRFYLFGVNNKDKARLSAIALLELQKAELNYIGLIVHEAMEQLTKKDQIHLTRNADKQFINLKNFQQTGVPFIKRCAA